MSGELENKINETLSKIRERIEILSEKDKSEINKLTAKILLEENIKKYITTYQKDK